MGNHQETFAYTNHTLLPEALERWPLPLLERLLPRNTQIIYEINRRWLEDVERHYPGNSQKQRALSIIEESQPKVVNMANLAIVGSRKINGVSALHSELLKHHMFKDFWEMTPKKFTNKTNGITPRRWIKLCNPRLTHLITSQIGDHWITDLDELKKLTQFLQDPNFCEEWQRFKRENKENLAKLILAEHEMLVNLDSIFDCQVKRFHEYKRQLLNILRVVHHYHQIKDDPQGNWVPQTVIFGGKAALAIS